MKQVEVNYVNFPAQFAQSADETIRAIRAVFERGDFVLGQEVEIFEREFAELCHVKHAIGVANGTDSLILCLRALDVGPGDEVITVPNSWISSASAIALIGAKPVFVDVQNDQNISPVLLEKSFTPKTKAVMPVHLTGRCADLPAILEICKKKGIPVIEDAAQSVMAKVGPYTAGNGGLLGSFSLHPLKNLNAAGDAGMITTNDDELAGKLKLMRNHGLKTRDEVDFWGYNSRLDTLQAAILRLRLKQLPDVVSARRATAAAYSDGLKSVVQCPNERATEFHTYHTYVIQCDRRDQLRGFLAERGIETKVHYPIPIHLQRAARDLGYGPGSFPMTEMQTKKILSLPIHQFLTKIQVEWVITSVVDFYRK